MKGNLFNQKHIEISLGPITHAKDNLIKASITKKDKKDTMFQKIKSIDQFCKDIVRKVFMVKEAEEQTAIAKSSKMNQKAFTSSIAGNRGSYRESKVANSTNQRRSG